MSGDNSNQPSLRRQFAILSGIVLLLAAIASAFLYQSADKVIDLAGTAGAAAGRQVVDQARAVANIERLMALGDQLLTSDDPRHRQATKAAIQALAFHPSLSHLGGKSKPVHETYLIAERLMELADGGDEARQAASDLWSEHRRQLAEIGDGLAVDMVRDLTGITERIGGAGKTMKVATLATTAGGILVFLLVALLLRRSMLLPIVRVAEYLAAARFGPPGKDLPEPGSEEIAEVFTAARQLSQTQNTLRLTNEELRASNAELESFAHVSAHDLREPLRNIICYSEMLERQTEERLTEGERQCLDIVRNGALRMDQLIKDLLEFSHVGRDRPPPSPVPIRDLVADSVRILKAAVARERANLEIDLPLAQVLANPDELIRVFVNLIGNALKYRSPNRSPVIRISAARDGNVWRIAVTDNGIGLQPGKYYEERIFRLFQRLHHREDFGGGTGIGLAVCRKIVENHGGAIWVESPGPDRGCSFFFTLPASDR